MTARPADPTPCRCGHTGDGPHPCHWGGYTCRAPATRRIYRPRMVALAGMAMKLGASDTWACDGHWSEYAGGGR